MTEPSTASKWETIRSTDEDGVRIVTLARPDALNAVTNLMMDELADEILAAANDPSIRVVVLTGAGRAFTAGADLTEMGRPKVRPRHGLSGLVNALIDFPKPLVVAINGLGVGLGATVVGLADFVYMAEGARLRCPFSALGVAPELGSTATFPALMGRQRASWFLMAGEWLDAEACVAAGLALEVVSGDVVARAVEQAQLLAALPLVSLMTTKELVVGPIRPLLRQAVQAENQALRELIGGPANREAIAAFKERREPQFHGL